MALDPELLAILVCPQCREAVEPNEDQTWLVCQKCRLRYPVKDDIPIMLPDEASPIE